MADIGEGPGGPEPPLFWQKKNKQTNKITKKKRRKNSLQGKRYLQINIVSTSPKKNSSKSGSATGNIEKNTISSFYIGELTHAIKFRKHNLHMLALNAIFDCFA